MRKLSVSDLQQNKNGKIVLIYSTRPKVGKSTTTIQTSPEPILVIYTEQRNFLTSLEALHIDPNEWYSRGNRVVYPEGFEDLQDFLNECYQECKKGQFPFKTISFDSFGYWINIEMPKTFEMETYQSKIEKLKKGETIRNITEQFQFDQRAYGSLASSANRIMGLIKPFSQFNILVVLIFQNESNPKYNTSYAYAPYIKGQQFGKDLMSHFDYIGLVKERYEQDEHGEPKIVFPPIITFEEPNAMVAWCGDRPKKLTGVLNFKKIFKLE